MTLTEYLESISPLNNKEKLSWLGKSCKDCGNEKCKKLGTLPKGCDCALWQEKECGDRRNEQKADDSFLKSDPDSVNKGDVIYRQAAIEAIRASALKYTGFMEMEMYTDDDAVEAIECLPSAQPEIIRCKECEHWDTSWQNDFAPNHHYCPLVDGTRRGDFYCADAEMRGEQDD